MQYEVLKINSVRKLTELKKPTEIRFSNTHYP